MNLSTLLNDDNDNNTKSSRRPSTAQSRPSLPTLKTDPGSFHSLGPQSSPYTSLDGHYASHNQSPSFQRVQRPNLPYATPQPPHSASGAYAVYPQTGPPHSPYGPNNHNPNNPYPSHRQTSHHSSSSTPSSAHAPTPTPYRDITPSRDQYPYQGGHISGSHQNLSQPGTPLAPPNGPFRKPSHNSIRDSPSPYVMLQSPSNATHASPGGIMRPSPAPAINNLVHPSTYPPPSPAQRSASAGVKNDREKSVSVSPKTVVSILAPRSSIVQPATPTGNFLALPSHATSNGSFSSPGDERLMESARLHASMPTESSFLIDPLHGQHQPPVTPEQTKKPIQSLSSELSKQEIRTMPQALDTKFHVSEDPAVVHDLTSPTSSLQEKSTNLPTISMNDTGAETIKSSAIAPLSKKRAYNGDSTNEARIHQAPLKRRRVVEVPIWAQQCKKTAPLRKYRVVERTNGTQREASVIRQPKMPVPIPIVAPSNEILGHWEPTFTNIHPHEEVTRQICDFLFRHGISDQSMQNKSIGTPSSPQGSLEIEARLGSVISKDTRQRLKLPVSTECVLDESIDIAFESMMTVNQHREFNERLNDAVRLAHESAILSSAADQPTKPRNPVHYVHTKERDTFHDLPETEVLHISQSLPPAMGRRLIGVPRRPRLRVTRDQKTGEVLAQIIKIRIADLHIYNPRSEFDWRISLNAEINWVGDLQRLIADSGAATGGTGPNRSANPADRNKDRMTYRHQACQIDLTQVKPTTARDVGPDGATHELEVELDATLAKEQALLVIAGQPNKYEEVVQSFVDNVRTLTRWFPKAS